jgi:hypothetical protein
MLRSVRRRSKLSRVCVCVSSHLLLQSSAVQHIGLEFRGESCSWDVWRSILTTRLFAAATLVSWPFFPTWPSAPSSSAACASVLLPRHWFQSNRQRRPKQPRPFGVDSGCSRHRAYENDVGRRRRRRRICMLPCVSSILVLWERYWYWCVLWLRGDWRLLLLQRRIRRHARRTRRGRISVCFTASAACARRRRGMHEFFADALTRDSWWLAWARARSCAVSCTSVR